METDNKTFKTTFVSELAAASVIARFGVAGATHLWQPIDHGIGAEYKRLIGRYYFFKLKPTLLRIFSLLGNIESG
mgnify:CR=1 FL=1